MTYAFHSTVVVSEGSQKAFEERRPDEDAINAAPGFMERLALRDKAIPRTYYYVSIWQDLDRLQEYRDSQDAKSLVQHIQRTVSLETAIRRVDCDVLMRQTGSGLASAGVVIHATNRVKREFREEFEQVGTASSDRLSAAEGFCGRLLLREAGGDGVYRYISAWRTIEDNERYKRGVLTEAARRGEETSERLEGPLERSICDLVQYGEGSHRLSA